MRDCVHCARTRHSRITIQGPVLWCLATVDTVAAKHSNITMQEVPAGHKPQQRQWDAVGSTHSALGTVTTPRETTWLCSRLGLHDLLCIVPRSGILVSLNSYRTTWSGSSVSPCGPHVLTSATAKHGKYSDFQHWHPDGRNYAGSLLAPCTIMTLFDLAPLPAKTFY